MHICSSHQESVDIDGVIFDFSERFGPLWIGRNGKELKNQIGTARQWQVFNRWLTERESPGYKSARLSG